MQNTFIPAIDAHNYPSSGAICYKMTLPKIKEVTYGEYSISYQSANSMVTKYPKEKLHLNYLLNKMNVK